MYQEQRRKERERDNYRNETNSYINRLEANAQKWQHWYTWLQILLLVFSALTATMAGIDGVPRLLVSCTGLIATIAGSFLTTFKIQERIYASRKAIAEVRVECQKYDYHIEEYKDMNTDDAYIKFSKSINLIQSQQMLQDVELWNPKKEEQKAEKSSENNIQEGQGEKESNETLEKISQLGKLSDEASEDQRNETAQAEE